MVGQCKRKRRTTIAWRATRQAAHLMLIVLLPEWRLAPPPRVMTRDGDPIDTSPYWEYHDQRWKSFGVRIGVIGVRLCRCVYMKGLRSKLRNRVGTSWAEIDAGSRCRDLSSPARQRRVVRAPLPQGGNW